MHTKSHGQISFSIKSFNLVQVHVVKLSSEITDQTYKVTIETPLEWKLGH